LIPFIANFNSTVAESVNDETYIGFMSIMFVGSCLSLFLKSIVVRTDGSTAYWKASLSQNWKSDFIEVFKLLGNRDMILLTALFLASNFSYSWQFNVINGHFFNLRTRSFNSSIFWLSQMISAYLIAKLVLDNVRWSRPKRAWIGWIIVLIFAQLTWIYGYFIQLSFDRNDESPELDLTDSGYFVPAILFFFGGAFDAIVQLYVYWTLGALENNSVLLARFVGYYKSCQSLGAAVAWYLDAHDTMYMNQLIVNWCLISIALILAFLPIWKVKQTSNNNLQNGGGSGEDDHAKLSDKVDDNNNNNNNVSLEE